MLTDYQVRWWIKIDGSRVAEKLSSCNTSVTVVFNEYFFHLLELIDIDLSLTDTLKFNRFDMIFAAFIAAFCSKIEIETTRMVTTATGKEGCPLFSWWSGIRLCWCLKHLRNAPGFRLSVWSVLFVTGFKLTVCRLHLIATMCAVCTSNWALINERWRAGVDDPVRGNMRAWERGWKSLSNGLKSCPH